MQDQEADLFALADAILGVARHIEAAKQQADEGASPLHGAVLRYIDQHPGATVGEVAEANRILSSNVSRALRGLEQAGYVRRVPDEADARRVRLYPTECANENLDRLRERWSELLDGIPLNEERTRSLTQDLRQIEDHLLGP